MNKDKKLFYHSFRHKRYKVVEISKRVREREGSCEAPTDKDKAIEIPIGHSLNTLDVHVHEALHACMFNLDEDTVEESSTDIAKFLWKLGWRNVSVLKDERVQ